MANKNKNKKVPLFGFVPERERFPLLISSWRGTARSLRMQGREPEAKQIELCADTLEETLDPPQTS